MKRIGNLWPQVVSLENLFAAAKMASAGKRSRPDVARFLMDQELEIVQLRRELLEETYTPGAYRTFIIDEPKRREISAAPFRDRVVHHALTRIIEPIFERRFSRHSYACRKGFGTHRAIREARRATHNRKFVLKCDISKFFASIDHQILKAILAHAIKCPATLRLAGRIIDGSNPQEEVAAYFPGDDLFTPFERRRGLPLGNQTSQFFANVYLNGLDQFVERELRPECYVRYVDDFLLFGDDKRVLTNMRSSIRELLAGVRLRVHPGKSRVYRTQDGFPFLGWRILPDRLRLVRSNVIRFRRTLRALQRDYRERRIDLDGVTARVRAWTAHASHGDTRRLREQIVANAVFERREWSAV